MADADRIAAALRYQQEMDAAQRPATMNPNLASQGTSSRNRLAAALSSQNSNPIAEFARQAVSLDPQPNQGYGTMAAEMALGFVPGVGQAMAARDIERARRDNDPVGMGMAASSFVPFGKLIGGLRKPMSELITYHGTPHRFPPTANNPLGEFDPMKIGTGEGAQAYGAGAGYLAEDPSVGAAYRRQLSGTVQRPDVEYKGKDYLGGHFSVIEGQAVSTIADALAKDMPITEAIKQAGKIAKARFARDVKQVKSAGMGVDEFLQSPEEYKALLRQIKAIDPANLKRIGDPREPGNLYKVDLPDEHIAKMLDWDKPLSEQTPYVQKIMNEEIKRIGGSASTGERAYKELMFDARMQGNKSASSAMRSNEEAIAASNRLRELGIPGIRYLDQGSRAGGSGTSNFVVFDPKHMNIIGRE